VALKKPPVIAHRRLLGFNLSVLRAGWDSQPRRPEEPALGSGSPRSFLISQHRLFTAVLESTNAASDIGRDKRRDREQRTENRDLRF